MAKKIKRRKRKTKKSSRSQLPDRATEKRSKWVLILTAVVCICIAGFFLMKYFCGPDEKSQKTELHYKSITGPDNSELSEEEKIAALKTEEVQLIQQLLRDFPGSDAALAFAGSVHGQHGNDTEAVKFLNKALQQNPNRADVHDALGWVAFFKGAHEEAISNWNRALKIDSSQPGLRSSIAFSLMLLGRHSEAIEQLENDIQLFPRSVYSHFLLGQAYLQLKDYKNSKKHYEAAVELDQDYVDAYYGLFTVCSRLKQQDKAREYMAVFKKLKADERKGLKDRKVAFEDATEMRKTMAENQILAARIYRALGRFDKIEDLLHKAIVLDPENPKCLMELADLYSATNRPTEALKIYKRLSEIEPQYPVSFMNIGLISVQLKMFNVAEKAFREVIKLAPHDSRGYRELAWLYLNTKKSHDEARKLAEEAVKLEKTAANYYVLTCACEMNGDRTNALKAIEQAIKLEPDNSKYKQTYQFIKNRK